MIGPLEPAHPTIRWIACTWMLFPRDEEYRQWFKAAGFHDSRTEYIRLHWYRGKQEYAIAIAGVKPTPGPSPARAASPDEETIKAVTAPSGGLLLFSRVVIGSFLGFLFIPIALFAYFKNSYFGAEPLPAGDPERLNSRQVTALPLTCAAIVGVGWVVCDSPGTFCCGKHLPESEEKGQDPPSVCT